MIILSRTKCEKFIYKILSKAFTNVKINIIFSYTSDDDDEGGNLALTYGRNDYDFRYEGNLKINNIEYGLCLTKKTSNPSLIVQLNKLEKNINNQNELFKTIDNNLQNIKEI